MWSVAAVAGGVAEVEVAAEDFGEGLPAAGGCGSGVAGDVGGGSGGGEPVDGLVEQFDAEVTRVFR